MGGFLPSSTLPIVDEMGADMGADTNPVDESSVAIAAPVSVASGGSVFEWSVSVEDRGVVVTM